MPEKSSYPLELIQKELNVKALIHLERNEGIVDKIGNESVISALEKSNLLVVLDSEIAMPIRLSTNHEIYEMVLQNNRGIVAKEGRANRYLIALRLDSNNILAAIGDDLDPGIALFEMMRFSMQ